MSACITSASLIGALLLLGACERSAEPPPEPAPPSVAAPNAASPNPDETMPAPATPDDPPPSGVEPPSAQPDAAAGARDGGPTEPDALDAGPWVPPEPLCADDQWQLAPGFLPAKHVDYIADRDMRFPDAGTAGDGAPIGGSTVPYVISSAGTACATARDRASCEAGLELPMPALGRHLVTTSGDSVRIWALPAALQLLGVIDTTAEAMWVLAAARGEPRCSAEVTRDDDGFLVEGVQNFTCRSLDDGGFVTNASVRVLANGDVMEIFNDAGFSGPCPESPPPLP